MAASVWMRLDSCPSGPSIVRLVADTMPVVTLGWPPRLSALPMAITGSPTSRASDEPSSAGTISSAPSTLMTARSLDGSLPTRVASYSAPSNARTVMPSDWAITWALVMIRPSADSTTPVPAPSNTPPRALTLVSIVTTDSSTRSRMARTSIAPSAVMTGGRTGRGSPSSEEITAALAAVATSAPTTAATRATSQVRRPPPGEPVDPGDPGAPAARGPPPGPKGPDGPVRPGPHDPARAPPYAP